MEPMLAPCTICRRHLREGASLCPFCGAVFDAPLATQRFDDVRRIGRLLVAGTAAGLITTAFACSAYGAPSEPFFGSCRPGAVCARGICEPSPLDGYGRCAKLCVTHADCQTEGNAYACLPSTAANGKTVCFPPIPCPAEGCPTGLACLPDPCPTSSSSCQRYCIPTVADSP